MLIKILCCITKPERMTDQRQTIRALIFDPPNRFRFNNIEFENPLKSKYVKFVDMEEIGIIMSNDPYYKYIGTFGIATCIALIGRCNQTKITFVVHFSDTTDVDGSIHLLNSLLDGSKINISKLDIWLIGGFIGYSEQLFDSIMLSLKNIATFSFTINNVSVMKSFVCKNVAININNGEIHDYIDWREQILETDTCVIHALPRCKKENFDIDLFEVDYS